MRYYIVFYILLTTISYLNAGVKDEFVNENIHFAITQTKRMLSVVGEPNGDNYPRTSSNNKLITTQKNDWTPGFFPGSLWYLYELTNDSFWRKEAEKWTNSLESMKTFTGHHDLGFIMNCSYGNALRLAPKEDYKKILITSAEFLSSRYSEKTQAIKSWNQRKAWDNETVWLYPVIVDNMMNLELLFNAYKLSGNKKFYNIAVSHANSTMKNHLRKDYSSYHVVDYDTITGAVKYQGTCQGYSDNSIWARGQAWIVYGYTMMYRETKDPKYLKVAKKSANYFIKNLPEDLIPVWDFNVGQKGYYPDKNSHAYKYPGKERDVSAGAIVCSALFELDNYVKNRKYSKIAEKMLFSLASPKYRTGLGENSNFILQHSVGSIPHNTEIDVPLIYADYYFLEALLRYKKNKEK